MVESHTVLLAFLEFGFWWEKGSAYTKNETYRVAMKKIDMGVDGGEEMAE